MDEALTARPDLKKKLTLRFVGIKSAKALKQISVFRYPEVIELLDLIPKRDAARVIRESSALLLINAPEFERYVPGKLYDYLRSGRPVVVFGKGGEIESKVLGLSAGYVVSDGDSLGLQKVLEDIVTRRTPFGDLSARAEWLRAHTRSEMTRKMLEAFEQLRA